MRASAKRAARSTVAVLGDFLRSLRSKKSEAQRAGELEGTLSKQKRASAKRAARSTVVVLGDFLRSLRSKKS
ncbi:MAG: hypothetical protein HRU15_12865 [Planctomycetes bacterium]|nr:hypothetical protein [Planctomycetota bacterium]